MTCASNRSLMACASLLVLSVALVSACASTPHALDVEDVQDGTNDAGETALDSNEAETQQTEPLFEFGVNVTGTNTPEYFSPLADGDELGIELGFQGLWMVVLAFRTRVIFTGQLTIITSIRVGEDKQGELGLARQKLIPGGDGLGYYYNLFLVVKDPAVAGQQAEVTLDVTDGDGHEIVETRSVNLVLIEPNR